MQGSNARTRLITLSLRWSTESTGKRASGVVRPDSNWKPNDAPIIPERSRGYHATIGASRWARRYDSSDARGRTPSSLPCAR